MTTSHFDIDALLATPVRFSRLKKFGLSAAHYAEGWTPETDAMRKGSALHSYLLGGKDKVAVYPGVRNKKAKRYQAFLEEHKGRHIMSAREMIHVEGMRRSIEAHPIAMDLLDDGVQEQTISWEFKGRACLGTPDVVRPKNGRKRLVELKSSDTTHPEWLKRKARRMHYPAQVSWYADALAKSLSYEPGPVDEVYVVAVESTPPYPVTVLHVRESMLTQGRDTWRPWFDTLLECERLRQFPPYTTDIVEWEDDEGDGLDWGTAAE